MGLMEESIFTTVWEKKAKLVCWSIWVCWPHNNIFSSHASASKKGHYTDCLQFIALLHWQVQQRLCTIKNKKILFMLRGGYLHFTVLWWFHLTSSAEMAMSLHEGMIGQSILFWLNGDQWMMAELILFQNEEAELLWTSAITVLSSPAQTV